MNKSLRILPILAIVFILIGYFFLTYQTFKLKEKRETLKKENEKLEQIRMTKTAEIKKLDSIYALQQKIILKSDDPKTVEEGKLLDEKIRNISTSHFTQNSTAENDQETAQELEKQGYQHLFDRNVENSIKSFTASENAYNSYHQVYEIARFLRENKTQLSNTQSEFWPKAYQQILQNYSWKMPQDVKEKLTNLANQK